MTEFLNMNKYERKQTYQTQEQLKVQSTLRQKRQHQLKTERYKESNGKRLGLLSDDQGTSSHYRFEEQTDLVQLPLPLLSQNDIKEIFETNRTRNTNEEEGATFKNDTQRVRSFQSDETARKRETVISITPKNEPESPPDQQDNYLTKQQASINMTQDSQNEQFYQLQPSLKSSIYADYDESNRRVLDLQQAQMMLIQKILDNEPEEAKKSESYQLLKQLKQNADQTQQLVLPENIQLTLNNMVQQKQHHHKNNQQKGLSKEIQSLQNKENKQFLKEISEVISLTDRSLKPYSRVKSMHFNPQEKQQFKQKLEQHVSKQINQKLTKFKEKANKKDQLKQLTRFGVDFKQYCGAKENVRELSKVDSSNFWTVAQYTAKNAESGPLQDNNMTADQKHPGVLPMMTDLNSLSNSMSKTGGEVLKQPSLHLNLYIGQQRSRQSAENKEITLMQEGDRAKIKVDDQSPNGEQEVLTTQENIKLADTYREQVSTKGNSNHVESPKYQESDDNLMMNVFPNSNTHGGQFVLKEDDEQFTQNMEIVENHRVGDGDIKSKPSRRSDIKSGGGRRMMLSTHKNSTQRLQSSFCKSPPMEVTEKNISVLNHHIQENKDKTQVQSYQNLLNLKNQKVRMRNRIQNKVKNKTQQQFNSSLSFTNHKINTQNQNSKSGLKPYKKNQRHVISDVSPFESPVQTSINFDNTIENNGRGVKDQGTGLMLKSFDASNTAVIVIGIESKNIKSRQLEKKETLEFGLDDVGSVVTSPNVTQSRFNIRNIIKPSSSLLNKRSTNAAQAKDGPTSQGSEEMLSARANSRGEVLDFVRPIKLWNKPNTAALTQRERGMKITDEAAMQTSIKQARMQGIKSIDIRKEQPGIQLNNVNQGTTTSDPPTAIQADRAQTNESADLQSLDRESIHSKENHLYLNEFNPTQTLNGGFYSSKKKSSQLGIKNDATLPLNKNYSGKSIKNNAGFNPMMTGTQLYFNTLKKNPDSRDNIDFTPIQQIKPNDSDEEALGDATQYLINTKAVLHEKPSALAGESSYSKLSPDNKSGLNFMSNARSTQVLRHDTNKKGNSSSTNKQRSSTLNLRNKSAHKPTIDLPQNLQNNLHIFQKSAKGRRSSRSPINGGGGNTKRGESSIDQNTGRVTSNAPHSALNNDLIDAIHEQKNEVMINQTFAEDPNLQENTVIKDCKTNTNTNTSQSIHHHQDDQNMLYIEQTNTNSAGEQSPVQVQDQTDQTQKQVFTIAEMTMEHTQDNSININPAVVQINSGARDSNHDTIAEETDTSKQFIYHASQVDLFAKDNNTYTTQIKLPYYLTQTNQQQRKTSAIQQMQKSSSYSNSKTSVQMTQKQELNPRFKGNSSARQVNVVIQDHQNKRRQHKKIHEIPTTVGKKGINVPQHLLHSNIMPSSNLIVLNMNPVPKTVTQGIQANVRTNQSALSNNRHVKVPSLNHVQREKQRQQVQLQLKGENLYPSQQINTVLSSRGQTGRKHHGITFKTANPSKLNNKKDDLQLEGLQKELTAKQLQRNAEQSNSPASKKAKALQDPIVVQNQIKQRPPNFKGLKVPVNKQSDYFLKSDTLADAVNDLTEGDDTVRNLQQHEHESGRQVIMALQSNNDFDTCLGYSPDILKGDSHLQIESPTWVVRNKFSGGLRQDKLHLSSYNNSVQLKMNKQNSKTKQNEAQHGTLDNRGLMLKLEKQFSAETAGSGGAMINQDRKITSQSSQEF